MIFHLRICLRDILNIFREWEIAFINIIKRIEDELMQNERAEKERRKMKNMMMKSWEKSFFSLIIIYNNIYINFYDIYACIENNFNWNDWYDIEL